MTEIEKKALALVEGILPEDAYRAPDHFIDKCLLWNALCRAIEQHEAFRQEVSAMLIDEYGEEFCRDHSRFARFIIAKPDPLVEVIADYKRTKGTGEYATNKDMAAALRAAIEKRGGKIVWGEG